ncbi:MAG: hypothetical protein ACSHWZ_08020 [Sulfitobacter sp.]
MTRISALICLLALPVAADVAPAKAKVADCYCTDRSHNRVELGETICLSVDGRMFMAQCQMSLNVPMWREVSEGCLSSQAGGAQQPVEAFSVHPQI